MRLGSLTRIGPWPGPSMGPSEPTGPTTGQVSELNKVRCGSPWRLRETGLVSAQLKIATIRGRTRGDGGRWPTTSHERNARPSAQAPVPLVRGPDGQVNWVQGEGRLGRGSSLFCRGLCIMQAQETGQPAREPENQRETSQRASGSLIGQALGSGRPCSQSQLGEN